MPKVRNLAQISKTEQLINKIVKELKILVKQYQQKELIKELCFLPFKSLQTCLTPNNFTVACTFCKAALKDYLSLI